MAFTDLRPAGLVALLLLLGACATAPDAPPVGPADEAPEPSALPSGPVTANPYEQQRIAVPPGARQVFEQALSAMAGEQWSRAETLLRQLSDDYPQLSGPQVNLGLVHAAQGDTERAIRALTRALEINPKNLDAYQQLALLKRGQGDFERAEELYLSALQVWPFHAPSHRNIGILYDLYQGEWDKALLHYRAYQQLQSEPDREVTGWIIDLERRIDAQ